MGELLAIVLGFGVGMSLGALGGGGSTLAVPILVFVAGLSAQDATTVSLLVVGVAALVGAASHLRAGHVHLAAGLAFGAAGIVGSRLGLTVNRAIDERLLLLAFSALIVFVAVRMYRHAEPDAGPTPTAGPMPTGDDAHPPSSADRRDAAGNVALATAPPVPHDRSALRSPYALLKLAGAASLVGVLTGLFGVGGGFAVVPALTLLLGFGAIDAIGTSLVVVAVNAAMALAMRAGDLHFDWSLVAPFLATTTLGVLAGTAVARRVPVGRLTRSFAILLGVVAAFTVTSTLLGV